MKTIQLSDDEAAALKAKAEAQGLTLEQWLRTMARQAATPAQRRYTLADLLAQCDLSAPLSAEDRAWLDAPSVGREA